MGCCGSSNGLDYDQIKSDIVLQLRGDHVRYHGTTERGRFQTLGKAELILTADGIYSQIIGSHCCGDRGYIHIPLQSIRDIRDQAWFNGLYRLDRPHLVISYIVPGKGEFEAGWQITQSVYEQWHTAIERLLQEIHLTELV